MRQRIPTRPINWRAVRAGALAAIVLLCLASFYGCGGGDVFDDEPVPTPRSCESFTECAK